MGKVDQNKQQKQSTLLQTAFELFTTKGVVKTSISDIVSNAGVAKGTFYLYFKDKIDIKNKLIIHKSNKLFEHALDALDSSPQPTFSQTVIFVVDNIINQLSENPMLMQFISKNLSWGVFKTAISCNIESDIQNNMYSIYNRIISMNGHHLKDPDIMMYMILELVSSVSYSSILYDEPVPIERLKPYLYESIRVIIKQFEI
ncbi:MAG: TetR/AcrR family transcriptional regulator [Oscillospiraceae bacterium]|nr:TetR/AcrR family transcriptional regulator [Oscillospiraceae bacterium]